MNIKMMVKTNEIINYAPYLEYVKCSKYRYKAFITLCSSYVKIPTEIAKESGIRVNHISKVLGELVDKGLIVCLNPQSRKGRLYQLTPLGVTVKNILVNGNQRFVITNKTDVKDKLTGKTYANLQDIVTLLNEQDIIITNYKELCGDV